MAHKHYAKEFIKHRKKKHRYCFVFIYKSFSNTGTLAELCDIRANRALRILVQPPDLKDEKIAAQKIQLHPGQQTLSTYDVMSRIKQSEKPGTAGWGVLGSECLCSPEFIC